METRCHFKWNEAYHWYLHLTWTWHMQSYFTEHFLNSSARNKCSEPANSKQPPPHRDFQYSLRYISPQLLGNTWLYNRATIKWLSCANTNVWRNTIKAKTNEYMMKKLETDQTIVLFGKSVFHLVLLIYWDTQSA